MVLQKVKQEKRSTSLNSSYPSINNPALIEQLKTVENIKAYKPIIEAELKELETRIPRLQKTINYLKEVLRIFEHNRDDFKEILKGKE
ncbi:hypothetical protein [Pseudoalteromonas sp. JC3]|uniref:hypothetical protein n=1 Tax=Pseudoalteromonas sp. JC3 TaxID=2810196 RepID=UPI0019D2BC5B|nr:hypothetical protein [Pseudoalteromonas sp. JC3]MBR8841677.1 hypothetical protein [Pseudoalteromonas sp. JC3]WJE07702.1 hypothetical protein QSH61_12455 [Pseudoalteromonas sp. JC3]